MQARTWLLVALALGCAILIVHAEEETKVEEPATAEVAAEATETEPTEELDSRYGPASNNKGGNHKGRGGGKGRGNKGSSNNNSDNSDSSNNNSNNRRGGRGNGSGNGRGRGNGSGNGRNNGRLEQLAGNGLRNKVINRGTRYLGTKRTYSGSTKVVRSRKDNWYHKNFVNTVTSNLKTLAKQVHVDTKTLIKKPLTVDNLRVHQQTNYVKNIWPKLEKVWVSQFKEVVAPSHAETVSRSASAQSRTVRHRLQVSSSSRHRNLGTRYERTQELGIIGGNAGGFGGGRGHGSRGGSSNNNNSRNSSNNNNRRNNRGGNRKNNNSSNNRRNNNKRNSSNNSSRNHRNVYG